MAFVNEKTADGKWQTIDREKNASLTKVSGPDQEGNYDCELVYDDSLIRFHATSGMKIHGELKLGEDRQCEMNWKIFRLYMPEEMQGQKSEIGSIITEALRVYGDNFNTENAHSVDVKFL